MGHAGAIISGYAGTAAAKKDALEAHGVRVGQNPTEAAQLVAELVGATPPDAGRVVPVVGGVPRADGRRSPALD